VGGYNVGLHNLYYPDNAYICRRERLVIYARGTTINMATCGLCIVYAFMRMFWCDVFHIEIVVKCT
jgi:hypothetical protein